MKTTKSSSTKQSKLPTVLISAGGTGGHIFPALAVAQALSNHPVKIIWFGSYYGMEQQLVPQDRYPLFCVSSVGLRGKNLRQLIVAPFLLFVAFWQTLIIFLKTRPNLVFGMGGFSSALSGVVAKLLGIPLVIHEQNAILGATNRMLSRLANQRLQAFHHTFKSQYMPLTTGNPILFTPQITAHPPHSPLHVLILGGSQGAQILNQTIPQLTTRLKIYHQCGHRHIEQVKSAYFQSNNSYNRTHVKVVEFIDNMAQAYTWADLVICRSGAMTISELMCTASASILIPLPTAINDHQMYNARILTNAGAAILLPQSELSVTRLDRLLAQLDAERIMRMAKCAHQRHQHNATQKIVDSLLNFVNNEK